MAALRLVVVLAVSLAALAPTAGAAPGAGMLEAGSLRLAPGASVASAGVDVLFQAVSAEAVALDASEVAVHRIGITYTGVGEPGNELYRSDDDGTVDERTSHATGRITILPTSDDATLAIRSAGPMTGDVGDATVRGMEAALLAARLDESAPVCEEGNYGCLDVFGVYEIAGSSLSFDVSGPIEMIVYGATVVVEDANGRTEYTSGLVASEETGPVRQTQDVTVLVRAGSASGRIAGDARAFSSAPTIRTPGVVFEDASGAVRVGALDYRAQQDDVSAAGDLTIAPGPVARAERHDGGTVYASTITTRVSGDIQTIDLEGRLAFLDSPAQRIGAAAVLVAILGGAAYAWQHVSFAAAALYTRLNKPDILENDVRNHIYDIIVQNPGISAREVHRRSSQSWGTVVYHLRQLERHHLVVSRALGRTRNYYENHGKYKGMEAQLACLQSDRARVLARAIVAAPGITQEDLAIAVGLPQPTTSYYVRKLKQAGLVEEQREGRYVKYVPVADLPRFIQLSESSVQSGGPAGSGVQA